MGPFVFSFSLAYFSIAFHALFQPQPLNRPKPKKEKGKKKKKRAGEGGGAGQGRKGGRSKGFL